MKVPILSIIIPMYNCGAFIEKTVNNLLSSNVDSDFFEIILIDDGSIDNTKFVCEQTFKNNSNVHYFYKSNGGIASSRNFGIAVAKGKYLFFHDHDDIFAKENFDKIIKILNSSQSNLLFFESCTITNNVEKPLCIVNEKYDNKQLSKDDIKSLFETLFFIQNKGNIINKVGQIWTLFIKRDFVIKHKIEFVIRCDYEDDFTFILECLLKDDCTISTHKINTYKWVIRRESESHCLKYDPNFMDRVSNYLSYLDEIIGNSKFSSLKKRCISNIEWRKTRDYLLLFGRGTNVDKSFSNFIGKCKKYHIRERMIQKTTFKKSKNQRLLCFFFKFKLYRLAFRAIIK